MGNRILCSCCDNPEPNQQGVMRINIATYSQEDPSNSSRSEAVFLPLPIPSENSQSNGCIILHPVINKPGFSSELSLSPSSLCKIPISESQESVQSIMEGLKPKTKSQPISTTDTPKVVSKIHNNSSISYAKSKSPTSSEINRIIPVVQIDIARNYKYKGKQRFKGKK
ncbi:hypothetical protein SteCoe_20431 [Stentor coeruleus]|uniref:Uncharacterized protein n=1 Tax=Stentor coeruleus TaxID=5963 RepID=A0A1R2BRT5_9CILI|nr:hypothetical protein SteCoe_20431 [Stentor coeruleus]